MSAACNGAVNVYSSFANGPPGWSLTCGTSEATPEFAAIVALADQVAGHPLGLLNPALYALLARARARPGRRHRGQQLRLLQPGHSQGATNQGTPQQPGRTATLHTVTGYQAGQGYNLVTGVGTVDASQFVYELAGVPAPCSPPVEHRPHQLGQLLRVDGLVGRLQLGHRPPAGRADPIARVHGRHLAKRPPLLRHPTDEEMVVLPDQPLVVSKPVHVGLLEHLGRGDRDVGPAGLLGQLAAGGRVEILVPLDPAARRGPVLLLRRRVVVEEEQHSPGRIDRDYPSRQPHGVLRFTHATNYPIAVR